MTAHLPIVNHAHNLLMLDIHHAQLIVQMAKLYFSQELIHVFVMLVEKRKMEYVFLVIMDLWLKKQNHAINVLRINLHHLINVHALILYHAHVSVDI